MATNFYLQVESILGSSTNPGHVGWMDVQSYSRNVATPNDLQITAGMDAATTKLLLTMASGKHFNKVRLAICDSISGIEVGSVTLNSVLVTKLIESGSRTGQVLVNYTFNGETVTVV